MRKVNSSVLRKVFRIGTVRYNWSMSAHASQAFSIAHCTDSEDLPRFANDIAKASLSGCVYSCQNVVFPFYQVVGAHI